jgi:hypothetical protein
MGFSVGTRGGNFRTTFPTDRGPDVRSSARAIVAALVALVTVVTMAWVAEADQHRPIPTRAQVQAAKDAVARRTGDVAAIRAELVVAQNRADAAAQNAELASEAYNGAVWRLQLATAKAKAALIAAKAATVKADGQRAGIAALATQSFEQGTELTGISAYLGSGGPAEVADQITLTHSVGVSLQDRYNQYAAAQTLARTAQHAADQAKRDQQALTTQAACAELAAAAA